MWYMLGSEGLPCCFQDQVVYISAARVLLLWMTCASELRTAYYSLCVGGKSVG